MKHPNKVPGTLSNDRQETKRLINRKRVANIRRRVQGALQRIDRLVDELYEVRSIVRRRFVERTDTSNNTIQIRLRPFEVATYRNKRAEIEQELTLARRDHMIADKEYRDAINNNYQVNTDKLRAEKKENSLRRKSKNLLTETVELIKDLAQKGGSEEVEAIRTLAKSGDVKGVRAKCNELLSGFAPEHHATISGVQEVKTEIIHGLMEELAQWPDPNNLSASMESPQ
jgi:hypothetical protein